jgi:hypothetical protein
MITVFPCLIMQEIVMSMSSQNCDTVTEIYPSLGLEAVPSE